MVEQAFAYPPAKLIHPSTSEVKDGEIWRNVEIAVLDQTTGKELYRVVLSSARIQIDNDLSSSNVEDVPFLATLNEGRGYCIKESPRKKRRK